MIGLNALLLGAVAQLAAGPSLTEPASGVVFEDLNRNGTRDSGEPGIEGVRVSNGAAIALTDAEGAWSLPAHDGAIFFVIKPSGYAAPVSADNLPLFYYIHNPVGTPADLELRFDGVFPTGALPQSVDFPLTKQKEPDNFKAVLFADPQPQTRAEVGYIRDDVVEELVGIDAAWGLTAGDIMFDDMSLFPRYNRLVGKIGLPWYNVPGNHELNFLSPDDQYSLETFKRLFGPTYYSFDYAGVHVIVLDNVFYHGKDAGRETPDPRNTGQYEGRITQDQLDWLAADLKHVPEDQQILLFGHIPLMLPGREDVPGVNIMNRRDLFALFKSHPKVKSFAGHTHTNYHVYFTQDDGWPHAEPLHHHTLATVSGAWWGGPKSDEGVPTALQSDGVPNGYHILSMQGGEVRVRYKGAGLATTKQMRISLDADFHGFRADGIRDSALGRQLNDPISADHLAAARIVVNVFNASPVAEVTMSVDGGEPELMEHAPGPDPLAREFFQRHAHTKKSWVEATPTGHLWRGKLPRDLAPGAHTVTVRAPDAYGVMHEDSIVVEVVSETGQ